MTTIVNDISSLSFLAAVNNNFIDLNTGIFDDAVIITITSAMSSSQMITNINANFQAINNIIPVSLSLYNLSMPDGNDFRFKINRNFEMLADVIASLSVIFEFTEKSHTRLFGLVSTLSRVIVRWGDGTADGIYGGTDQVFDHTYTNGIDNVVKVYGLSSNEITKFSEYSGTANIYCDTADLPRGLLYLNLTGNTTIYGNCSDLPRNLDWMYVGGVNTIGGDCAGLPRTLTYCIIDYQTTISGDVADLPRNLWKLRLLGVTTITGDCIGLPRGLTYIEILGNNTIHGDCSGLPRNLDHMEMYGNSNLSGDISGLPRVITWCSVQGVNTLTGDIGGMPNIDRIGTTGSTFTILGNNTISGDVADMPRGICCDFTVTGHNTIGGDFADLPRNLPGVNLGGSNTLGGDVAGLPPAFGGILLSGWGANNIYGDINDIPRTVTLWQLLKEDSLSGDIADLPPNITRFSIFGSNNTIHGDIATAPATLTTLIVHGKNTLSGNPINIPSNITQVQLVSDFCTIDYVGGVVPSFSNCSNFEIDSNMPAANVDAFLIGWALTATSKVCSFGMSLQRTAASDAAVATLTGLLKTIVTHN